MKRKKSLNQLVAEVRTPGEARERHAEVKYGEAHDDALRVQEYVTKLENVIDRVLDNPERYHRDIVTIHQGQSRNGDEYRAFIAIKFKTDMSSTTVTMGDNLIFKMSYYDMDSTLEALKQYYGQHGWRFDRTEEGIILSHYA